MRRPTGFEKLVRKLTFPAYWFRPDFDPPKWVGTPLIEFLFGTTLGFAVICLLLIVWTFTVVITVILLYPLWLLLRGLCRLVNKWTGLFTRWETKETHRPERPAQLFPGGKVMLARWIS